MSLNLVQHVHSAKSFVRRADAAWKRNNSQLIGDADLPRLPPEASTTDNGEGRLVGGLLTNLLRHMRSEVKKAGPAITAAKRWKVLLLREEGGGWIVVRALFRPLVLWGWQLDMGLETEGGTFAHLKQTSVADTELQLPLIVSMREIRARFAGADRRGLQYMLPSYSVSWRRPLRELFLHTQGVAWSAWSEADLEKLTDDAASGSDGSDNSNDDGGSDADGSAEGQEMAEVTKSLRQLRSFGPGGPTGAYWLAN